MPKFILAAFAFSLSLAHAGSDCAGDLGTRIRSLPGHQYPSGFIPGTADSLEEMIAPRRQDLELQKRNLMNQSLEGKIAALHRLAYRELLVTEQVNGQGKMLDHAAKRGDQDVELLSFGTRLVTQVWDPMLLPYFDELRVISADMSAVEKALNAATSLQLKLAAMALELPELDHYQTPALFAVARIANLGPNLLTTEKLEQIRDGLDGFFSSDVRPTPQVVRLIITSELIQHALNEKRALNEIAQLYFSYLCDLLPKQFITSAYLSNSMLLYTASTTLDELRSRAADAKLTPAQVKKLEALIKLLKSRILI